MADADFREVVSAEHPDRETQRQLRIEAYAKASAPLVAELIAMGYPVDTIGDLRRKGLDYKDAVPALLRWLPVVENIDVKDDIVRALGVKQPAGLSAPLLVREFRRAESDLLRWTIGDSLSVVADDRVFSEIVDLVTDRSYGRDRERLAVALSNMRDPRAVDVLIQLLEDEDVAGHAVVALGKLKAARARPHLEKMLSHPKSWVRREAKRAIAKIDKARPSGSEASTGA